IESEGRANSRSREMLTGMAMQLIFLLSTSDLISGQIRYSIPEEMERGALVGNIAEDLGLKVWELSARKFRLVSDERKQYFQVNSANGILFVNERIDREQLCGQRNVCSLSCQAMMENPLEIYRVEVEILDINDNSPSFPKSRYSLQVLESVTPGTRFPLESAHDPDVGTNTIRIYEISSNDHFVLNIQTARDGKKVAELVLEKSLDREQQSNIHLTLKAIDGGLPERFGVAEVIIDVVDVNDNAPIFDNDLYRTRLKESSPRGTLVIKIHAADVDEGSHGEVAYFFSNQASEKVREIFTLDQESGEIRVRGTIDFEESEEYEFAVEAMDNGAVGLVGHSKVLVEIIDVNDNAPEIQITIFSSTVPEDAAPETLVALISVTDRDSGRNGDVQCQISTNVPFKLQKNSENHYKLVSSKKLDRETNPMYNISISAWDNGSPPLSTNKSIVILVSDTNDNAPRFEKPSYNIYVAENNSPGASIYAITATDPDLNQNSDVSYSILTRDSAVSSYISINSNNGNIHALRSFDYEEQKKFEFQVEARDAGVPSLSGTTRLHVIILDQNDNAPVIVSPLTWNGSAVVEDVPQSAYPGHLVTKVVAKDADSGQNARLSYQVLKATVPSLFSVGQYSGEIRTARSFSDQNPITQRLVILVKDNGAQDPDVGTNSLNTYLLSPNDYFSLDVQTGSDHGKLAELVLKTNLDREKQAAYKLVLTALDGGSPVLSGTTLIKITVLDSNDNMPIFDHTIYRVSVLENVLKGTLIIRLNATDADEGANGEVMYNFRRRTPKKVLELFKLEPNTGEIRVQGVIDFEENNVYEMIVEAKDKGASAVPVHCKVVVTVLDMNDNAPQVILTSLSSPIPEDAPPGTVVALITVTDQESEENGEVRCQIQHDVPFQLNSSSKNSYTLVTRYSLDREASSHYSVVISCRDLGLPPLVTNKTIQVEVSDINDNAPHFAHRSFTAYVTENTHPGSSIFSVTAFDLDKHRNAHLSYSILHTEVKGAPVFDYVSINSESGIIFSQNSFDYEQLKNFQVGVQVQDGGDPPLTANVTVNVVILDQNDNAPLIVSPIPMDGFDAIISPSVDLGYQVTKIIATDADSGQNARLSYQLLDATQPGVFNVISNSGEIRTTRRLDDLKDTVHRLVIMVKDSGHPSLSATGTVSLSIIDGGAEMLSDFSGNVPKSTDSSDLAFYIIISLGSISCVLLVTIIALVTTICHNDSRSSSVCSHNSELVSNFMEVRGTGSLSRTYCYKVHSASESGNPFAYSKITHFRNFRIKTAI
uniref:Cadherin domain-containing protein n=1 Tax=Callorhinchus milii TaxID=7868 RepID=A0A4W3JGB4_CALMI